MVASANSLQKKIIIQEIALVQSLIVLIENYDAFEDHKQVTFCLESCTCF